MVIIKKKWHWLGIAVLLLALPFIIYPGPFILNTSNKTELPNISPPPHQGVGAYVINLAHSQERYAKLQPLVEALNLPWQRVEAIYGAHLSDVERENLVHLPHYHLIVRSDPSLGTLGCYLSHIKVWRQFLASKYEYALILEDDISFEPQLLKDAIEALLAKPSDWDIVNFDSKKNGTPLSIAELPNGHNLVVYLSAVSNAGAYLLNRKAAERMLQKALPIQMPIDYFFTRSWEFGLRFTGVEPRLVKQTFGDSEIGKTDAEGTEYSGDKAPTTLSALIHKRVYTNGSELVRFVYNLWRSL